MMNLFTQLIYIRGLKFHIFPSLFRYGRNNLISEFSIFSDLCFSDLDSDELEQLDRSGEEGSDDSSEDKDDSEEAEGQEAAVTPANGHDDSNISDQEDVVEDFEMSDSDSGED